MLIAGCELSGAGRRGGGGAVRCWSHRLSALPAALGILNGNSIAVQDAGCVELGEEGEVAPTAAGRIASVYYLQHTTMAVFAQRLGPDMDLHVRILESSNGQSSAAAAAAACFASVAFCSIPP